MVSALVTGRWVAAGAWLLLMAVSFAAQGLGHAREANPAEPFTGPLNAIGRVFLEQWVTFPRYVLSGGWARALRDAR